MNLEYLTAVPLEHVEWLWRRGYVDDEIWEKYSHLWQTSAPRFSVQACRCSECMKNPVERY